MKNKKIVFNIQKIHIFIWLYLFYDFFYISKLNYTNIYSILKEYLGIYENFFFILIFFYIVSLFIKNPISRNFFRVRLFFGVILGISTGYLYLLETIRTIPNPTQEIIESVILDTGLLKLNLGYLVNYTFIEIIKFIRLDILLWSLIFLIFISIIIICAKLMRKIVILIINVFKKYIAYQKKTNRVKFKKKRLEHELKIERELYEQFKKIQNKYK